MSDSSPPSGFSRQQSDSSLPELQIACGAIFAPPVAATEGTVSRRSRGPLHFGDPAAEYAAATTDVALFDAGDRAQIEITGGDRVKFLHSFCTNDVKALAPGSGCEAFVTNVKGRVLGHIFVFAGESSLWLESVPGSEEALLAHLDRYIVNEDVQLHSRTAELGELYICGPGAARRGSQLIAAAGELPPLGHVATTLAGAAISVRRVDFTLAPGFQLCVPRPRLAAIWGTLRDAGMPPAGSQVFEALRIEAGMPWYGIDVTEDNLAQEAGRTSQAISFKKGCYLGQEPVARIDAMGHVNRELRGLRLNGTQVPAIGSAVLAPDDRTAIGVISSAAMSYANGRPVALACLRSQFTKPGTQVLVGLEHDGAAVPATVFWPSKM